MTEMEKQNALSRIIISNFSAKGIESPEFWSRFRDKYEVELQDAEIGLNLIFTKIPPRILRTNHKEERSNLLVVKKIKF